MVFSGFAREKGIHESIVPISLVYEIIQLFDFVYSLDLRVLIDLFYLFAKALLNLRINCQIVQTHMQQMSCRIHTSNEKSKELFQNLLRVEVDTILRIEVSFLFYVLDKMHLFVCFCRLHLFVDYLSSKSSYLLNFSIDISVT